MQRQSYLTENVLFGMSNLECLIWNRTVQLMLSTVRFGLTLVWEP